MHSRWTRRIDLYMGRDVEAARAFGQREVQITWTGS
jgi:3D (Asp-Asp-Asp) domain-containing protein